jgi:Mrp family chromosome partitioning ATPase/predicted Fe-Mo cluster-binding NifX family protein
MKNQGSSCSNTGQDDQHRLQDIEIRNRLGVIKNKILVMSGKGGVGKSSVASYLAVALAKKGNRVGLMDVDLHGPSIPHILGLEGEIGPGKEAGKAHPVEYIENLEVVSIEPLMGPDKDRATIWRGPIKIGVIRQFISDIEWNDLDYLIIDSPPGTGDEPLTVAQTIPDARALIVTTPQEISLADVRKSINFCRQVGMDILGLVENMSGFLCPHCGEKIELFKTGGGMVTAKKMGLNYLGSLPIDTEVVNAGDAGSMRVLQDHDRPFTQALNKLVDHIEASKKTVLPAYKEKGEDRPVKKNENSNGHVLAIPVSEGKLSSHFGHCEHFAFIQTDNGRIKGTEMKTPPPHEPGVLPKWLYQNGANVVIAGGMGQQAQKMLEENGIKVIVGAPMDPPEALAHQYLSGTLVTGSNVCDH